MRGTKITIVRLYDNNPRKVLVALPDGQRSVIDLSARAVGPTIAALVDPGATLEAVIGSDNGQKFIIPVPPGADALLDKIDAEASARRKEKREEQRAQGLERKISRLEEENLKLQNLLEELTAPDHADSETCEPEKQDGASSTTPDDKQGFRELVKLAYEELVSPERRDRFPLRSFTISDHLLSDADRIMRGKNRREKIARAVAQIVSGDPRVIGNLQCRAWRVGRAGPQLVEDGFFIMRANLANNTPAAARLKYGMKHGLVRFDSVLQHDAELV